MLEIKETRDFKQGIFLLSPRKFGTVAEIMAAKLFNLSPSDSNAYDKLTDEGKRVEVKFSRVLETTQEAISEDNLVEQCINSGRSARSVVSSHSAARKNYNCNIQQIKPEQFDILIYGLCFKDKIEVFKLNADELPECPTYSDKQHRNNKGEGQFHITKDNIGFHRNRFKVASVSYREMKKLIKKKKVIE